MLRNGEGAEVRGLDALQKGTPTKTIQPDPSARNSEGAVRGSQGPLSASRKPPSGFDYALEVGFLDRLYYPMRRTESGWEWWLWCQEHAWPFIEIFPGCGPAAEVFVDLLTIAGGRYFSSHEHAKLAQIFARYAIKRHPSIIIGGTAASATLRREHAVECARDLVFLFQGTCGSQRWRRACSHPRKAAA